MKMRKTAISLALALLLVLAMAPGAWALSLELPQGPDYGAVAPPVVYSCADITCRVGDMAIISVNAQSTDGGTLSYQWYRSLDGTNTSGSLIVTATGINYWADTSREGTYYYFCQVTNTTAVGSNSVISAPIAVRVEAAREPVIEGIGVLTLPNKTQYKEGERLETDGLSVRVYTDQGYYDVTAGLECSPATLSVPGTQTITVRYENKSCTFTVEVEAARETVQSVSVASLPAKTSYTVGDRLDTTGLVVRVVTNKQVKDVTEGFTCTPVVLNAAGRQTIKVIYGVQSTSFEVTVAERATATPMPTVSPVPSATAAPQGSANPSPSATPHTSSHQSHETSAGSAVLQIILVLALLALVGLGAYVYTVQRKNRK
ncbi:MAG: bacterial Ig-like domain-containing protein [Oscillospiraceae bacterium]|nr:bacterial Ig-like domain-containing protein [Oscillospiraceae bacterium]